ncbi:hypothetical protein Taro_047916 [Colocasia esculenta]|uniref:Glycerol-3-phosphate acyltransferase RAM2/GPAT1-8 HAD-like domain-containing protein n=1 Tax=Colocasia esculenta TaxID=4460 RepID=A0A843WX69_COLES|nr:hypothetical protein [Colocasia esculenta]
MLYPFLCCMSEEVRLKVMAMVCFCGVKVEGFRVGRAVLPKHLLQDGFQLLTAGGGGGKKVCVTRMPMVMVEATLKEYLGVEVVVGRELKVAIGRYTGFMEEGWDKETELWELFGEEGDSDGDGEGVLWVGRRRESHHHHPFFSMCKMLAVPIFSFLLSKI